MSHAIPLEQLGSWLSEEVGPGGDHVGVLAGHFAIFSAGQVATDLLDDAHVPPAGARDMLEFTRLTWRAACRAASTGSGFRFVLLVDDVQFVRPELDDRRMSERLATELARNYRERVPRLPTYHARELAAHGVAPERVLAAAPESWIHSERELRIDSVRRMRELSAGGGPLTSSADGSMLRVTLPDGGDYCLVHSGRTSCVGGYLELLARLYARDVRKLIAMVPMQCLGQIAVATSLGQQLFGMRDLNIVNVAVPDPAVGLPAQPF